MRGFPSLPSHISPSSLSLGAYNADKRRGALVARSWGSLFPSFRTAPLHLPAAYGQHAKHWPSYKRRRCSWFFAWKNARARAHIKEPLFCTQKFLARFAPPLPLLFFLLLFCASILPHHLHSLSLSFFLSSRSKISFSQERVLVVPRAPFECTPEASMCARAIVCSFLSLSPFLCSLENFLLVAVSFRARRLFFLVSKRTRARGKKGQRRSLSKRYVHLRVMLLRG